MKINCVCSIGGVTMTSKIELGSVGDILCRVDLVTVARNCPKP